VLDARDALGTEALAGGLEAATRHWDGKAVYRTLTWRSRRSRASTSGLMCRRSSSITRAPAGGFS
jgi:hypothetical protein